MVSVIFYSTSTCGYCKPIKTMLENLHASYDENEVLFHNIVVDKDYGGMDNAREWGINAVPTILIIADKEEKERMIGDITQEKVTDAIQRNLQSDVLRQQSGGSGTGGRPLLRGISESEDVRERSD